MIALALALHPFRYNSLLSSKKKLSGCAAAIAAAALTTTVLSTTITTTLSLPLNNFHLSTRTTRTTTRRRHTTHFATMVPPEDSSSAAADNTTTSTTNIGTLTVAQFPCLQDNYGYLVHDSVSGATAAIDTPCALAYQTELEKRQWTLTHIFNTHHHKDHTGGNLALKELYTDTEEASITIIGPKKERDRIPGIDVAVQDGDVLDFGGSQVLVMDAGGHTKGHISFYFPTQSKIFVGDCLFSLGCGRMFEGTPEQFWNALERHRALPDNTLVYCAHEYTEANAKFAMSVEPGNPDLVERVAIVQSQRARQEPTVPTWLGEEKKVNPFLRVDFSPEIRKRIGVTDTDTPAQAFAKLRRAKDQF